MNTTANLASTKEMIQASEPAKAQIVSVPPVAVKADERIISWSRRSTKQNPVEQCDRYRGIVVKADSLLVPADACNSKFYNLLQTTIHALADACFTDWVRDNMHTLTVETSRFCLDRVLAFWADERQRLTVDAEKIIAFLKDSATMAKFDEAKRKAWLHRVPKIAAPGYAGLVSKEQAAAIIAQVADSDLENPVCIFIITRCNTILNAESATEAL
jgi:hypothetical protein